jgi:hypothetical protein
MQASIYAIGEVVLPEDGTLILRPLVPLPYQTEHPWLFHAAATLKVRTAQQDTLVDLYMPGAFPHIFFLKLEGLCECEYLECEPPIPLLGNSKCLINPQPPLLVSSAWLKVYEHATIGAFPCDKSSLSHALLL